MKNVQLFKKAFSAFALSIMIGSAQNARAIEIDMATMTKAVVITTAPQILYLVFKTKASENPIMVNDLGDFWEKLTLAIREKNKWKFFDDVWIGWLGKEAPVGLDGSAVVARPGGASPAYGILSRIVKTAKKFHGAIEPFDKLAKLAPGK